MCHSPILDWMNITTISFGTKVWCVLKYTRVYMDIQHCWIARHCAIIFQHKYWILCTPLLLDSAVLNIYKCWNKKNPVKVLNIMYTIVIQHCWIVKNSAQLQKFSAVLNFMYTLAGKWLMLLDLMGQFRKQFYSMMALTSVNP